MVSPTILVIAIFTVASVLIPITYYHRSDFICSNPCQGGWEVWSGTTNRWTHARVSHSLQDHAG